MPHILCHQEMQIKTKAKYHYTSIRVAKIQNTDNSKCQQGCGAAGIPILLQCECKIVQSLWKTVCQFLTKLNMLLPYDPETKLLDIYPNELKTYVNTKTCMQMLLATLLIISQTWKQPRSSSVGEWINYLWYIQTMEYYSK